jgi:rRNA maturation RNase YbeY
MGVEKLTGSSAQRLKRSSAGVSSPGPPIALTILNRQRTRAVDLRRLRRITRLLLSELLQVEQVQLGICLVAAPEMTRLNETFLRHAGPTDVIAFNYLDRGGRAFPASSSGPSRGIRDKLGGHPALDGEIFVCVDEALIQARRFRTTWPSELVRYVVHGLLHLRGFDDQRPAARHIMKREENRLLRELDRRFALATLAGRSRLARRAKRES